MLDHSPNVYFTDHSKYEIASVKSACCISTGSFAERCHCRKTEVFECKEYCDLDKNCKGYVDRGDGYCQIATTSNCPQSCEKHDAGNIGPIDPYATCGSGYLGCFIKQGIQVIVLIVKLYSKNCNTIKNYVPPKRWHYNLFDRAWKMEERE